MGDSSDVFLTPEQVARRLKIATPTVHRWLRNGELKGRRISGRWRVPESELEKYVAGQTVTVRNGRLNYGLAPDGEVLWFEVK